ncbi:MAG: hypothetical protein A2Y66_01875 [Nitrospirae bacterium RBG_13_41_22]|nr:MAG: hypothetical protein A2Y66_01875 [Nitrospirae bacterium RBG_13_41_22]
MDKAVIKYYNIGPYPVWFGFTTSEKAFKQELKRLGIKEQIDFVLSGTNASTKTFEKNNELTIIVTLKYNDKNKIDQILGLCVHEAVHVWRQVLDHIREKEKPSSEIEAYHIQNIAQFMISEILKQRKIK